MAISECPPSSKKLSWMPIAATPITSAQISASSSSSGVRGAAGWPPASSRRSGSGSARRSTLPFGVSGSPESRTKAAGTMYSGSFAARKARSASASGASSPAGTT